MGLWTLSFLSDFASTYLVMELALSNNVLSKLAYLVVDEEFGLEVGHGGRVIE